MGARGVLSLAVGVAQGGVGAFTIALAYLLIHDSLGLRAALQSLLSGGVALERALPICLLLLFALGSFSILSGAFLIGEWLRSR